MSDHKCLDCSRPLTGPSDSCACRFVEETMKKKAKEKKGSYHIVMMCCGYIESSMTSWLIFSSMDKRDKFETPREAVIELALDLHAKYEDEQSYSRKALKKCCQDTQAAHEGAKYCVTCGANLDVVRFDEIAFMDFVRDLHVRDCDGFGESEYANGRNFVFWPWRAEEILGAAKDEVVFIAENAEAVIRDALYEAKPELEDTSIERYDSGFPSDWEKVKEKGTNHST